jgi:hypothetical protein
VPAYRVLIWILVVVISVAVVYLGLGGRALLRSPERPERILRRRVRLADLESGPGGFDPRQPELPAAVVERFEPAGKYLLRFDAPVVWLGRTETHATIAAREVGHPVSLAAGPWRRRIAVVGTFGSGEPFLGHLRCM